MTTKNHSSDRGSSMGSAGSTEQLREKAGDVRQNLQEMGSLAREAAQEKASELRDTAQQTASQLRDTAQRKAGELSETAAEYYNIGRERAYELEQSLEERIRDKPLRSVLVAAGAGMLLGIIWMRR